jgi:hypothetical protein
MDAGKVRLASRLMKDPELLIEEICEAVGISSATLYRDVAPYSKTVVGTDSVLEFASTRFWTKRTSLRAFCGVLKIGVHKLLFTRGAFTHISRKH